MEQKADKGKKRTIRGAVDVEWIRREDGLLLQGTAVPYPLKDIDLWADQSTILLRYVLLTSQDVINLISKQPHDH
jgi:hypothetical protein